MVKNVKKPVRLLETTEETEQMLLFEWAQLLSYKHIELRLLLHIPNGGKKSMPNPYYWRSSVIIKMLEKQEYCGDLVNFKTHSKSYKNKRRIINDRENWVVFKNVHEPIVDRSV